MLAKAYRFDFIERRIFYPWLIWSIGSGFLFFKYLLQVSPSVMVDDLMGYFQLSGEGLGHLAACYFYAYMLMQLPSGILLDRINIRYLLTGAILICACGGFFFAMGNIYAAGFGRILIGIGGAFSAVGTMKLISLWFPPKRFAFMAGLMMTAGMLGAVFGQAPLALAVQQYGWQLAIFYCALIGVLLAFTAALCLRDKKQADYSQASPAKWIDLWRNLKRIISNPQCWLVSLYSGLAFAPISAFAGLWGVPFLSLKLGLDKTTAAAMISLIFIGFAIGCPLSGWFSDRIGNRRLLMAIGTFIGMMCLSIIIYAPLNNTLMCELLLFLFGFFTSFFFISFAVICEINSLLLAGTAIGFINGFDAMLGAFSEPTIGWLLDLNWNATFNHGARYFTVTNYEMALSLLPAAMLMALLLLCFIKETYCQSIRQENKQ